MLTRLPFNFSIYVCCTLNHILRTNCQTRVKFIESGRALDGSYLELRNARGAAYGREYRENSFFGSIQGLSCSAHRSPDGNKNKLLQLNRRLLPFAAQWRPERSEIGKYLLLEVGG